MRVRLDSIVRNHIVLARPKRKSEGNSKPDERGDAQVVVDVLQAATVPQYAIERKADGRPRWHALGRARVDGIHGMVSNASSANSFFSTQPSWM